MTIDRRELRWAMAVAAVVMALTCLPYIFGLLITPPGTQYMGFLGNPDDQNVYMAWMRQAAEGRILFTDLFTSEPQQAGFLHVYFLLLGLIARLTHLPLIWTYHAARIIGGWLLLLVFYVFCAAFTERPAVRRLALLLAAFSSGLGWLFYFVLPPGSPHPADFGRGLVMPEAVTFLTILLNPLFSFSMALMLATFLLAMLAAEKGSARLALYAGILGLILGNAHTYDMVTVYAVLALYGVVLLACRNFRGVALLALIVAISAPSVAYQAWLFRTNFIFRAKALTPTLSPPFVMMLLTFGIPLALAIPGAVMALRGSQWRPVPGHPERPVRVAEGRRFSLPAIWVVAGFLLLAFALFSFQRKLAEGLHLPVCLLAAVAVGSALETRTLAKVLLIALTSLSNIFFVSRAAQDLITNNAAHRNELMPPLYLRHDEVAAIRWLRPVPGHPALQDPERGPSGSLRGERPVRVAEGRQETPPGSVILSSSLLGSYIPGLSGRRVYIGHWAETIDFQPKLSLAVRIFQSATPENVRRALLERAGITHILYGPYERDIGDWNPATSDLTRLDYQNDTVQVFSVRPL